MPDLAVTFANERGEMSCYEVREGNHGLYLLDEYDNQIGWIPYDSVDYVTRTESEDDG